ncbi:hypothetical protein HD806DRAFT_526926 [Xylariaceae sp. AK1471]|nr:hypothetical protein HD806DRAFT_526926 [Xylariaceae sp. AK1471]
MDPSQADPPVQPGMPFKKMYQVREEVRQADARVRQLQGRLAAAQGTTDRAQVEWLRSQLRSTGDQLVSLQKKLKPLEANFRKAQKKQTELNKAPVEHEHEPVPVIKVPIVNTATLDDPLPPGGCHLTPDECQYDHLDRLRRQYAHPFELFCEEMDTISDTCLTGMCLALPEMPWSIAMSRLAFLFNAGPDCYGNHIPPPSDVKYLSAYTTIGCEQHLRRIQLPELMVIQDWRDFMRWAHHQSHHMCLEPIDCMSSRRKCRSDFLERYGGGQLQDRLASRFGPPIPQKCSSPGCWPACLLRHQFSNILHSTTVEFATFHQVSFGPITSTVRKDLYAPIQHYQLGKLVHDEGVGLVLPFKKSYGHIFVDKWEDGSLVKMNTLLQIPSLYTSEDIEPILQKLPTWKKISFNGILSSLFWFARRRHAPFLARNDDGKLCRGSRLDNQSHPYQCPFCHGFDNYLMSTYSLVEDFEDLITALQHMLQAHTRVPLTRKIKFLYEEIQECPTIRDAWKIILQEEYTEFISSLEKGYLPQVVADLCGYDTPATSKPEVVSKGLLVGEGEERTAVGSMPEASFGLEIDENGKILEQLVTVAEVKNEM